jgi:hypothetical protein
MGRPLKIKKTTTKDIGFNSFDALTNPVFPGTLTATDFVGVVGGNDSAGDLATAAYPTVSVRVKIGANAEANGYIIRQKGSRSYLVTDGTNTGICVLANTADSALAADTMTISFTTGGDSTLTRVSRLTNKWALDFASNRYLVNFFADEGTMIKSGTANVTVALALVENNT